MPDKQILSAAQNAELDHLINTTMQLMGASSAYDLQPRDQTGSTTLYGEYRIDNKNHYLRYSQLSLITPHTFIPLAKLGLSIVSGFRLDAKEGAENILKKTQTWADNVKLRDKMQNIARCTIRDGTAVAYLQEAKDIGIQSIQVLPMQYTTLLPEGITPGQKVTALMKGDVERAVLMESTTKNQQNTTLDREEFALFRLFHEGYFTKDILERETYGIYGVSLLEPLNRTIKDLLDLSEGFSGNMRRYGVGRLHINLPLVEKLRSEGKYANAKKILEDTIAAMQKLKPNEDLITGGAQANPLPGTHSPGVREMKQSYEKDIHVGLLQSGVSMGDTKGSTYASGYLAEEDRYIILESIQELIRETVQTDILDRQLAFLGQEPGTVQVKVDKLDIPYVDYTTLTDARINGDITEKEYRLALGFPEEKPQE
ncbi:MAG: hypothetical protein HF975_04320 [ANME-2 cluster archaeon]|nr:hypothetical protein [ANME-2 cluster archaeon]